MALASRVQKLSKARNCMAHLDVFLSRDIAAIVASWAQDDSDTVCKALGQSVCHSSSSRDVESTGTSDCVASAPLPDDDAENLADGFVSAKQSLSPSMLGLFDLFDTRCDAGVQTAFKDGTEEERSVQETCGQERGAGWAELTSVPVPSSLGRGVVAPSTTCASAEGKSSGTRSTGVVTSRHRRSRGTQCLQTSSSEGSEVFLGGALAAPCLQ